MLISKFKAMAFDVGRTLYQSKARRLAAPHIVRTALKDLGMPEDFDDQEMIRAHLEVGAWLRKKYADSYYRKGAGKIPRKLWIEHNREICKRFGWPHKELAERMEDYWALHQPPILPQPHLRHVLDSLKKQGFKLGVLSNTHRNHRIFFQRDQILDDFEVIHLSFETQFWKPSPKAFEHLCHALNLPPEQVLYVGDKWDLDMVPALSLGMGAIYFPQDQNLEEKYQNFTPNLWIIRTLDELLNL